MDKIGQRYMCILSMLWCGWSYREIFDWKSELWWDNHHKSGRTALLCLNVSCGGAAFKYLASTITHQSLTNGSWIIVGCQKHNIVSVGARLWKSALHCLISRHSSSFSFDASVLLIKRRLWVHATMSRLLWESATDCRCHRLRRRQRETIGSMQGHTQDVFNEGLTRDDRKYKTGNDGSNSTDDRTTGQG